MKLLNLLPIVLVAACSSGPSKQDSTQIFASATSALTVAQGDAVAQAGGGSGDLALDFTGPCALGGTVSVNGSYTGDGSEMAAFDLAASFNGCSQLGGSIDGDLHWTSSTSATGYTAAMTGELDWDGNDSSGSCTFDVHIAISNTAVSYSGSLCGYDVTTSLTLTGY
jgi:hypothetical protein